MRKKLLKCLIALNIFTSFVAQEVFNIDYNGSAPVLTATAATVNDLITINFTDVDRINNFYTDNQSEIFIYAGVETTAGTWQNTFSAFCVTNDANRSIANITGGKYSKTFKIKELLNLPDGITVKSFQFKFYNQYCGGGNNETLNFNLDLVDDVTGDFKQIGNVTVSPKTPKRSEPITITLNPAGTALSTASKVYLHAGIGTDKLGSTAFSVTTGNWGQDDGIGQMNLVDGNWKITLPSADSYFGLDTAMDVFGLNFLFRNIDGTSKEDNNGANYHVDMNPEYYFTMHTELVNDTPHFVQTNTAYTATATANTTAAWTLYETNATNAILNTIATGNSMSIAQQITLTDVDITHYYKIEYTFSTGVKAKYFSLKAYSPIVYEPLPAGMKFGVNYDNSDATKATVVFHTPVITNYYGFNKDTESLYLLGTGTTTPKATVHLMGDFNNWATNNQSLMKCGKMTADNKCEIWWNTITGLRAGKEYVYQFLVDGDRIADPYATKISDPWNDANLVTQGIYPNLITNPNTQHIAGILQTQKPNYNWQLTTFNFKHNISHNRLNIYELHFRDFTPEGTYKAATEKLDYLKELGVNTIHVMPVSEFEGNDSWGYNPSFYFAADKAYGPEDDLKKFIDEAHKRGIAVINDLVLNHSFGQSSMVRLYWDDIENKPTADNPWFFRDHQAVRSSAGHWGSDLNHTSAHTQKLVDDILTYWMTEFKFDGFRFDFTKGFSHMEIIGDSGDDWASAYNANRIGLLKRMVKNIRINAGTRNPIIVFEHLANTAEDKELADYGILMWSGVQHHNDMKEFALGYNNGMNSFYNSGSYLAKGFNSANWMSYAESHDEERMGYEVLQYANGISSLTATAKTDFLIDRLKLATAFNLLLPGPRMLWMWQELGYDVSINENGRTGRKPQHWEYYEDIKRKELYRLTSFIYQLRDAYDFYPNKDWGNIGASDLSARRMRYNDNEGHIVIVIGNPNTTTGQNVTPGYLYTGTWYKHNGNSSVDNTSYTVTDVNASYYLQPNEVLVLTNFPYNQDENNIILKNGVCDFEKSIPENYTIDDIKVYCNYTIQIDKYIPKSTLRIMPNVKFTLDFNKTLQVGPINVEGTLWLEKGSTLKVE